MLHIKSIEIVGGVAFFDLQPDHCRWPLDGGMSCGEARRDDGTSYCAHHHRVAYPQPGGGRAFSVGGFLRFRAEKVEAARPATARRIETPVDLAPQAIDQAAYATQARRIAATRKRIADSIAMTNQERIAAREAEIEAADARMREAIRLAKIKMQFLSVQTPQNVINQLPRIMKEVAAKYGVSVTDIKSARRKAHLVRARQEFFYRARHETTNSYPQIAAFCGGRDHTSGIWAVRQHEARLRGEKITRACHKSKAVDANRSS